MPYSTGFGDHFYCQTDGRLECGHVFLTGNGLPERWGSGGSFKIGELGFGTGFNFAETFRQWKRIRRADAHLTFTSFELFPMAGEDIARALSRRSEIDGERQALVSRWLDHPEGMTEINLDKSTGHDQVENRLRSILLTGSDPCRPVS